MSAFGGKWPPNGVLDVTFSGQNQTQQTYARDSIRIPSSAQHTSFAVFFVVGITYTLHTFSAQEEDIFDTYAYSLFVYTYPRP